LTAQRPAQALGPFGSSQNDGRYIFADLAKQVLPSVVTVYVKTNIKQQELKEHNDQLEQLRRLFRSHPGLREMMPFLSPNGQSPFGEDEGEENQPDLYGLEDQFIPTSSGSGIVITSDGYILTNHHVLTQGLEAAQKALESDKTKLTVVLSDGAEVSGGDIKVVYSHPLADLALLKINKTGLKPIKWGDSDKLRVGERVAAIGSPLDLKATVTQGIVCAKNRDIAGMSHLIQTDAVINPGSSGGALVNLDGELIGVSRLITSNSGRWQGFGFAIPSNEARWFADEVIKKGEIEFGYIGVEMAADGPNKMRMLATLGIDPQKPGVLISGLPEDSPAHKAGLQVGDFIVEADGHPIRENSDLLDYVKHQRLGATISITVLRANEKMQSERKTFKVTLTRRPNEKLLAERQGGPSVAPTPKAENQPEALAGLGLQVEPTTTDQGVKGLKVIAVDPRGPAGHVGIQPGDVLTEINRHRLESIDDLKPAIAARPENRAHLLKLLRDGREQLTPLEPGSRK
jgi:serine protease Do